MYTCPRREALSIGLLLALRSDRQVLRQEERGGNARKTPGNWAGPGKV